MRILLLLASLLLTAPSAWGDVAPAVVKGFSNECAIYTMCDAETDTGVCQNANGSDEIVWQGGTRSNLTFYSTQGVGAYTCNIITSDMTHDGGGDTANQQINSTSLTTSDEVLSFVGLFYYVWVNCSAVGTQATVTMMACPAER